ncbi:hypothetical protein QQY66_23290 [Streptomyces sp. DG2A-72]|uniref:hypothetical protein n=1 Tax=Streptomyces sp. DG2A-72 TaxID=3051386 RepID=UPI00265B8B83|nr:hypothetical protein [Streptomyces sp. DG2A-72]MDO0934457.1 hypothetical protein [Streptomyces sp. DG2A-72]
MARVEVPTWLGDALDRELYRRNAFRVSGLAVTATPRAVRRRVSEVRAAEALRAERTGGPAAGEARWLAPDPVPDHIAVREALRRLEDPVRRVVDEFFWFWPLAETGGTELTQAREVWARLAGSPAEAAADPRARTIAVHNLAVLHHTEALEAKAFLGDGTLRMLWERAYRYWRLVLADDGCWQWVDERIRVLDDPRLRTVDGAAFREALPAVLLDLHAQVAVDAARQRGGEDAARQHVSLMRGLKVSDGVVDAALRRVVAPLAAAVRNRTEALPGPGADPAALERAADSLLAETKTDVRVLRAVLGKKHAVVADAADEVAGAVNACSVACANSLTSNASTAHDPLVNRAAAHLRSARGLAASGDVRTLVEKNLAVLLSNDILLECKETVERGERSPGRAAEQASRLLDTVEPRLRELRELRPHAPETDQVRDAVAMAACKLFTEYANTTRDRVKALAGYRRVLPLAVSEEGRSVIRKNIDTLDRAATYQSSFDFDTAPAVAGIPGQCFRCGRSVGASEVLTVARDGIGGPQSIGIPCCANCRSQARVLLGQAGLSPDPYAPPTRRPNPYAGSYGDSLVRAVLLIYAPWVLERRGKTILALVVVLAAAGLIVASFVVGRTTPTGEALGQWGGAGGGVLLMLLACLPSNREK